MNYCKDLLFCLALIFAGWFATSETFLYLTKSYPVLMGFSKFFFLATMGEILGRRVTSGVWAVRNINILQRAMVWGFLGIVFTYIFPIYSYGVEGILEAKKVPLIINENFSKAFYKSFFMNMFFAFPMMTFHQFTDILIENNRLFTKWDTLTTFQMIDWENMFSKVGPSIVWFWIPAHTITFYLPEEYRILMAAMLGIALGFILSFFKLSKNKNTELFFR